GSRPQLVVALASLIGFALAAPRLTATDALAYSVLGVATGAMTSVLGAAFLDRYRRDAFVRTALLTHTSGLKQEEAEIAAALVEITEALGARLGDADVLERGDRLAPRGVGCG